MKDSAENLIESVKEPLLTLDQGIGLLNPDKRILVHLKQNYEGQKKTLKDWEKIFKW